MVTGVMTKLVSMSLYGVFQTIRKANAVTPFIAQLVTTVMKLIPIRVADDSDCCESGTVVLVRIDFVNASDFDCC